RRRGGALRRRQGIRLRPRGFGAWPRRLHAPEVPVPGPALTAARARRRVLRRRAPYRGARIVVDRRPPRGTARDDRAVPSAARHERDIDSGFEAFVTRINGPGAWEARRRPAQPTPFVERGVWRS